MGNPQPQARVLGRTTPLVAAAKGKVVPDHPALAVQAALTAVVLDVARDVRIVEASRLPTDVLVHLLSEYGELAEEVAIATGSSYKPEGADGVVGEAIDVVLCAVDLVYVLSVTLDQPLPTDLFEGIAEAKPPRHTKATSLLSLTLGMLSDIGLVEHLLGGPTKSKAQRESVARGSRIVLNRLVSDCLRLATTARPDLTADDLLAVATRKCAKWRAAYTPKTGADHGA
jgi:hypothetical protein